MRRSAFLGVTAAVAAIAGGVVVVEQLLDSHNPNSRAQAAPPSSYGNFGVDHWPDATWRPYSASSPFNTPIPRGTKPLPRSDEMIQQVLRFGPPSHLTAGVSRTPDDWGHPTYYSKATDPMFTLRATAPFGRNALNGKRIPIPDAAEAAGGGDSHMTIVTPDGWEYDLWQVHDKPAGGGTLTFSWGGRVRVDGTGLGSDGTASKFGNIAGMIRAQELAAGRINHALFVVLRCTGDGRAYGAGAHQRRHDSAYVYPAVAGGSECRDGAQEPPMGARLHLAMSDAQIDALNLPRWKAAILKALAEYGGYVGDTGGDGIGFMFESSTMYTSLGRPDPLVAIAKAANLPSYRGQYAFPIGSDVDWQRYLQVIPAPRRR
jgi:hypothetical protein